jgi:diguanylate cyclase (GGDEF)-like protein
MDPSTLHLAAAQLREVTDAHARWHENLLRSIFCEHPIDQGDLVPSAHRTCSFGHWFYDQAPNGLRGVQAFAAMGKEHQHLHQVAARLLRSVRAGSAIDRIDFEDLVATSARLRLQVDSLRFIIDSAIGNRDALTGAYGRIEMLPALHDLQQLTRHGVPPCTIVFMDVDNLKRINDQHGHRVGDAVLAGAVRHLHLHLRPQDKVFRYGGDEFLIALWGADLGTAHEVILRVRLGLAAKLLIAGPDGSSMRVTASFGLALLDPDEDVSQSIGRADQALLLAKTAGRNRAVAWDASVTTGTRWRLIDVDERT